ncbi:MAG: GGDEF domain-containing protein [Candidatus Sericytochromatia bacterium]|nr:GGDEF domain-containing protein [Candidatus Sericytochromatia bacterium]
MPGLTHIHNRITFENRLTDAIARYKRDSEVFSLLMLDIDWFKAINDEHGHVMGDRVLQAVADTLKAIARASGCVARYGGEKFVPILPHPPQTGAALMAERIQQAISEMAITDNSEAVISITVGIAGPQPGVSTSTDIIRRTDAALHDAKVAGRNRVVHCPGNG